MTLHRCDVRGSSPPPQPGRPSVRPFATCGGVCAQNKHAEAEALAAAELDELPFRLLLLRLAPHDTAALGRPVRHRVAPCYGGAACRARLDWRVQKEASK
jgi:hypothetical protein